jgi:hypothetical protein
MGIEENPGFRVMALSSAGCIWANSVDALPKEVPDGVYLAAEIVPRDAEDVLQSLQADLGPRLLVPEVWRKVLPDAGILISSSLSGGTLQNRLEYAERASPGRCWLRLERLRMRFPLPCPTGVGTALTPAELGRLLQANPTFYSPEFCCRYCYDLPGGIVLYDTDETWECKRKLAQSAGFSGAVIPSEG